MKSRSKIEKNPTYQEVLKSGFSGKNANLDMALAEVFATKKMREHFGKKLSESQLDLIGTLLGYARQAKSLPKDFEAQIRKSKNVGYTRKKATLLMERASEEPEGSEVYLDAIDCYVPGQGAFVALPLAFDYNLEQGTYAAVVPLDAMLSGDALLRYLPKKMIIHDKPATGQEYMAFVSKKYKATELGGAPVTPAAVRAATKEDKTDFVQLVVPYSQVAQIEGSSAGKGIVISVSNPDGPPYIVEIPFKEASEHLKAGGWKGADRPGCDEDQLLITAKLTGTKQLPNKAGLVTEFTMFKAAAVYDEWGFYHE